jgi:hypothetical protein
MYPNSYEYRGRFPAYFDLQAIKPAYCRERTLEYVVRRAASGASNRDGGMFRLENGLSVSDRC